ncbi:metallophosphoesterase [Schumannella sp. 10F1B-5-1]|uniref:LamG-like jellyroll fold domain-containing protein n=1 Tax=Schumannella sp. 10F1B-5-1 TaxID=2590780 RepID=UPI0011313FE6|nr:metallophosphoesterase [Schumannella sp. 10F1B-5-1]TPW70723.1 cell wall anchor protein [Schumannella sp. 10F1B-5-1]
MTRSPIPAPGHSAHRRRRPGRLALAALAAIGVVGSLAAVPAVSPSTAASAAAAESDLGSRFSLAVLPDTQFYSRYSAAEFVPRYGKDPFETQTQWIADHADELNIPFVAHLGDVVDQVNQPGEWAAADRAMSVLEDAGVPYSIQPGNHDVLDSTDSRMDTSYELAREPYLQHFPVSRAEKQDSFGGADPTGLNRYSLFEAQGQTFMVLQLSWRASDETLDWASSVLSEHPSVPVILTSHEVLNIAADGVSPAETTYGLRLWNDFIRSHDQVFLTLNGHFHGATRLTKTNDFGNPVTEILWDYQMAYEGGNGYLGLLEFDLSGDRISARTGSPWVIAKPGDALTSYDQPMLTQDGNQFELGLDFAERFAGFAPDFADGPADQPDLSAAATALFTDGFTAPPASSRVEAGGEGDFVRVDGTVAHWRFDGQPGPVAEGQVFEDVAGDSDLHRVPIAESGSSTAQVGDVTLIADADPFSSSGAVCFANSDQTGGVNRFSYLSTEVGAAANAATLDGGYTIETFVKLDEGWTASKNGWSKAVVRSGNRSQLDGMPWSRWDYTASPAALGVSNLREFQWTEVPAETTKGDRTAWSGEILPGRWSHVAIVNDAEAGVTTMYVDGAPVLRNGRDTGGQSIQEQMPWILGADWVDDGARNGWAGCIGETRVIDHPTDASQWLTARPALDAGFTSDAPSGTVQQVTAISGTGAAGATVTLAGDVQGSALVREDGSWSIPLITAGTGGSAAAGRASTAVGPTGLTAGSYRYTLTQGFGTRQSSPLSGGFVVAAAGDPGAGGGDADSGAGTGATGGTGDTALANTGVTVQPGLIAAALLLLLGASAVTITVIRRRRGQGAAAE